MTDNQIKRPMVMQHNGYYQKLGFDQRGAIREVLIQATPSSIVARDGENNSLSNRKACFYGGVAKNPRGAGLSCPPPHSDRTTTKSDRTATKSGHTATESDRTETKSDHPEAMESVEYEA